MADTVATHVLAQTATHIVVHLTNISDGTGEAAVVKVDKSTLVASDGAEPASLDIEKVIWNCDGMAARILWDHTTDDFAFALSGSGAIDFRAGDLGLPTVPAPGLLADPRSAGGAGDILLTTTGHTAADTYNIILVLRKQPD